MRPIVIKISLDCLNDGETLRVLHESVWHWRDVHAYEYKDVDISNGNAVQSYVIIQSFDGFVKYTGLFNRMRPSLYLPINGIVPFDRDLSEYIDFEKGLIVFKKRVFPLSTFYTLPIDYYGPNPRLVGCIFYNEPCEGGIRMLNQWINKRHNFLCFIVIETELRRLVLSTDYYGDCLLSALSSALDRAVYVNGVRAGDFSEVPEILQPGMFNLRPIFNFKIKDHITDL